MAPHVSDKKHMQTIVDFLKRLFTEDFNSEYNHSNYIDVADGKRNFHFDCSGFVYWCLAQTGYKRSLVELRKFLKEHDFIKINRFFCKDFKFIYEHKDSLKYWNFIDKPLVGCIMVVVFPDENGHCMFIDKLINVNKDRMCLRVIDSTCYQHKNDTRQSTGLGFGEIEIIHKNNDWFYNSNNKKLPIRKAEIYFVCPIK